MVLLQQKWQEQMRWNYMLTADIYQINFIQNSGIHVLMNMAVHQKIECVLRLNVLPRLEQMQDRIFQFQLNLLRFIKLRDLDKLMKELLWLKFLRVQGLKHYMLMQDVMRLGIKLFQLFTTKKDTNQMQLKQLKKMYHCQYWGKESYLIQKKHKKQQHKEFWIMLFQVIKYLLIHIGLIK